MDILQTVQPEMVTGYIGYFILGHYLSHYEVSKKLEYLVYVLGVILILAAIGLCYISSQKSGKPIQSFYENYTLAGFFCFSKTMYPRSNGMKNRKRGSAIWEAALLESI